MLRVAEQFHKTDTGRQRRANEDALFARAPVFAVADGMGGARAGEVASRMAVEAFDAGLPDGGSDEQRLAAAARIANERIHQLSSEDTHRAGMGTTLTAAYVGDGELALAHVGDSRAYRLRKGELERLTSDHSLVGELVRRGKLTEEEAEDHPQKSVITRALGPEPAVDVDTRTYPAQPGDVFLLCSDGLTSMVNEARVGEILRDSSSLEDAGRRLIDEANAAGGRDNITVVLFRLEEVPEAAVADQETQAGPDAPSAADVQAALAAQGPGVVAAPPQEPSAPAPRAPRQPRPAPVPVAGRRPGRIGRRVAYGLAVATVLALILAGGWIASRSVYFVGTDHGFVTVYRGLPYDLPLGIHLYQREYTSPVPATSLATRRRSKVLDHTLRSKRDAEDLVRRIELGQVGA